MMFARCPACQTVFRVRPEQLRAHHGRVRCGHCYAPFDALEHLQDDGKEHAARQDEQAHSAPQQHAAEPPPEPQVAPTPPPAAEPAPPLPEADPLAFGLIDEPPPRAQSPVEPAPHPSSFDLLSERLEFEMPDGLLAPRKAPDAHITADNATQTAAEGNAAQSDEAFPAFVDMSDLSPTPSDAADDQAEADAMRPAFPDAPPADWPTPAELDARFNADADASTFAAADPIASYDDPHPEPRLSSQEAAFAEGDDLLRPVAESADTEAPAPAEAIEDEDHVESGKRSSLAPDSLPPADSDRSLKDEEAGDVTPAAEERAEDDHGELERLDATYGPAPGVRKTHWLWGLGAGLLLGTLAAQSAYLFREELARNWPALRPALQAACERLGCEVPLSRVAGAISIETSDLQVLPRNPGRFVLNATVRNRATYPQAFPHLELTLTDVQDRPAVRRVLSPEEWVPAATQARELFNANEEIALKLPFEARSVDAVGYRLYAFYP